MSCQHGLDNKTKHTLKRDVDITAWDASISQNTHTYQSIDFILPRNPSCHPPSCPPSSLDPLRTRLGLAPTDGIKKRTLAHAGLAHAANNHLHPLAPLSPSATGPVTVCIVCGGAKGWCADGEW